MKKKAKKKSKPKRKSFSTTPVEKAALQLEDLAQKMFDWQYDDTTILQSQLYAAVRTSIGQARFLMGLILEMEPPGE
jgi:hypothetical protein